MHFHLLLFLLKTGLLFHRADTLDKYEVMIVPFKIENGTQTIEQVFLEYQTHSALYDEDVAVNVTIIASNYLSFAADQCGHRLFETTADIKNATYIWTRDHFNVFQLGIRKTCTLINQYAMDFIIDCQGPCSGKILFTIFPYETPSLHGSTNPRDGRLDFVTVGRNEAHVVNIDTAILIESVFLNSRFRLEFTIEYSTSFTLAIGKCGMKYLQMTGNGTKTLHVLSWKETRAIRMASTLRCPENMDLSVDLMMSSEEAGNGNVWFYMAFRRIDLEHHPLVNGTDLELARGIPKHKPPVPITAATYSMAIRIAIATCIALLLLGQL